MGIAFWIRRFALVFIAACVVIACAQFLKGRTISHSIVQGLIWAAISASVFTAARIYQSRRGQHCAICRDTPEMQDKHADHSH